MMKPDVQAISIIDFFFLSKLPTSELNTGPDEDGILVLFRYRTTTFMYKIS